MFKKLSIFLPLYFTLSLFFSSCSINPVTGKRELSLISSKNEVKMGEQYYQPMLQMQGGEYNVDPEVQAYVSKVGHKLAMEGARPQLPYQFTVINQSVPNAWALPGGKIAINRGLLVELDNEAELAAVLAHEVTHATARHTAQRISQGVILQAGAVGLGVLTENYAFRDYIGKAANVMALLVTKSYGRGHELEADYYGMKTMVKAGYNPLAAVSLQEKFVRLSENNRTTWLSGLFATHPPSKERVKANKKTLEEFESQPDFLGEKEYQTILAKLKASKEAYDNYDKGLEALAKGNPAKAARFAEEAIIVEPRESIFYSLLGQARAKEGDQSLAIMAFDKAIQYNDHYYGHYLHRGLLKEKRGEYSEAQLDLEASLHWLPTAQAHYTLGEILYRKGLIKEATYHFQQAEKSTSVGGEKARAALVKIDLNNNPGKYFEIWLHRNQSKELMVAIKNISGVDIEKLTVELSFDRGSENRWHYPRKYLVEIDKVLLAGKIATVNSGISPVRSDEELEGLVDIRFKQIKLIY